MPKLHLTEWKVDKKDVFEQRVLLMKILIENTRLGLKVSKDISDGLLENKMAVIDVEDLEKATEVVQKLNELGISVEIQNK